MRVRHDPVPLRMRRLRVGSILEIPTGPMLEYNLSVVLTAILEARTPVHAQRPLQITVIAAEEALSAFMFSERFRPRGVRLTDGHADWKILAKL